MQDLVRWILADDDATQLKYLQAVEAKIESWKAYELEKVLFEKSVGGAIVHR